MTKCRGAPKKNKTPTVPPRRSERFTQKNLPVSCPVFEKDQTQDGRSFLDSTRISDLSSSTLDESLDDVLPSPSPMTDGLRATNLLLFRGPRNSLSAFFHHPLIWNNASFISAEQAYQHEKLVFHRRPEEDRRRIMGCQSSHDVKRLIGRLIPRCSEDWDRRKFDVMEDICMAKARQCERFRDELRKSANKTLLHNVETDSIWGCGADACGLNMMGHILMSVRRKVVEFDEHFPALESVRSPSSVPSEPAPSVTSVPPPVCVVNSPQTPLKRKRAVVVGNSNARGLSGELNLRGIDTTGYVYPGQTAPSIRQRVPKLSSKDQKKDVVVLHVGDIEVRDWDQPLPSVLGEIAALSDALRDAFSPSQLVLCGLPRLSQRSSLDERIAQFNAMLAEMCSASTDTWYLDNSESRLRRDGVHLTERAKQGVGLTIAGHLKRRV